AQIDRREETWWYSPKGHKTAWRGKKLVIPLGPRSQAVLFPFLFWRDADDFLFTPNDTMALVAISRRRNRMTPLWKQAREWQHRRSKRISSKYNARSFRKAVIYAIEA